jgi:hypothetical protein
MWITSGIITNPTANQIILDTGPLVAKERIWQVFFSATVADAVDVQLVQSDGTTVRKSQILSSPTFGTVSLPPLIAEESMAENERIRLRVVLGGTKYISASIDYTA